MNKDKTPPQNTTNNKPSTTIFNNDSYCGSSKMKPTASSTPAGTKKGK